MFETETVGLCLVQKLKWKESMVTPCISIETVLASNKYYLGKKCFKYFIVYVNCETFAYYVTQI